MNINVEAVINKFKNGSDAGRSVKRYVNQTNTSRINAVKNAAGNCLAPYYHHFKTGKLPETDFVQILSVFNAEAGTNFSIDGLDQSSNGEISWTQLVEQSLK